MTCAHGAEKHRLRKAMSRARVEDVNTEPTLGMRTLRAADGHVGQAACATGFLVGSPLRKRASKLSAYPQITSSAAPGWTYPHRRHCQ